MGLYICVVWGVGGRGEGRGGWECRGMGVVGAWRYFGGISGIGASSGL